MVVVREGEGDRRWGSMFVGGFGLGGARGSDQASISPGLLRFTSFSFYRFSSYIFPSLLLPFISLPLLVPSRPFPNPHPRRSRGDSPIFVVDSDTSECLHYEPAFAYPKKKLAHIPREVLNEHKQVEVRYDLIDCGIDVCSSEVCLSSFQVILEEGGFVVFRHIYADGMWWCRSPRCSRITLITSISDATLSMESSRPTS
jgi:hypothetical protein